MESKATIKYLRVTPRKARLVADEVRGRLVGDALSLLNFSIRKAVAKDVSKLIKSAVANMQSKNTELAINTDELKVRDITVDQGPMLKRFRPRSQGRAYSIHKHLCHISVTVSN
ncbi:MAG: 50S ribosomal protein L22 [Chitinivibrionales bacterium]|nr:50S ribosomal protein L22 [Chitinivibrionales bacterium]